MGKGGKKAKAAAVTVAKLEEQERTEAAAREEAKRKAAEAEETHRAAQAKAEAHAVTECAPFRDAYWTCVRTPDQFDCSREQDGLSACCVRVGFPDQAKCNDLFP